MLSDGELQFPIDDDSLSGSSVDILYEPKFSSRLPTRSVPTRTGKWTSGQWAVPADADGCGSQVLRWPSPRNSSSSAKHHPRLAHHPILGRPGRNARTTREPACFAALTCHMVTSPRTEASSSKNTAPFVRTTPRTPHLAEAHEPHNPTATPRAVNDNWEVRSGHDNYSVTDCNAAEGHDEAISEWHLEVRLVSPRRAVASPRGTSSEHHQYGQRMRGVVDLMIPLEFPAAPVALFEKCAMVSSRGEAPSQMHVEDVEQWHTKDSSPHETRILATEDTLKKQYEDKTSPRGGKHSDMLEAAPASKGTPTCFGDSTNTLASRKKRLEELTCGVRHMQAELEYMRTMAMTATTFGEGGHEAPLATNTKSGTQKKRLIPSKRLRHRMASALTLLEHSKV
eukprot:GEMP01040915.1.p1 GENE.GEMP01040915.1~~GEMP01040915.1.p1  ORF type:complete len:396 (+),score=100.37 GEMP01040915.1:90-1277(+)